MSGLAPPGETTQISARRVVVVAPHYDDEVLGCGGLLAGLADSGARILVLFLSDSAGGCEAVDDPLVYRRQRREESSLATAALGIAESRHLELPDGALEQYRPEIAQALGTAILELEADLLLVPSPLEVTTDHRAAFGALHDLLGSVRQGSELAEIATALSILVYEVNHPAYPDLLVDVSDRIDSIQKAMTLYRSQQARHDYLAAAIGLRRYRTLSLSPEVTAAEGYRRLGLSDFTHRSASGLLTELGAVAELHPVEAGPLVSVVVRTKDRPELLAEALGSLAASSYRRVEVVLVNDGGAPVELPPAFPLACVKLDLEENRGRAAAANAGVEAASGAYIGFLDDDDLVSPEHLQLLVEAVSASDVQVAYSDAAVGVYELGAGSGWSCRERRLPYSRDFDLDRLLLDNYIPFNCLLIARPCFDRVGPFDTELPLLEDWDFLIRLAQHTSLHHLPRVTCEYRHFESSGAQHVLGGRVRERQDFLSEFLRVKATILRKHGALLSPERLSRAIDNLRFEAVSLGEEARSSSQDRDRLDRELRLRTDRYHRLNGEVVALREERRRLNEVLGERDEELERLYAEEKRHSRELDRLYAEEKRLLAIVDDQSAHLGRLYAQLESSSERIAVLEDALPLRLWRRLRRTLRRQG